MSHQLAHDRSGPQGTTPVVLVHAGIADRRMWESVWPALAAERDVVRLDLRGYGDSTGQPEGAWSPRGDVRALLADLGIERAHVIGCSFGAGVCAELALEHPGLVASLLLVAPGGSLLEDGEDLAAFVAVEDEALERDDLDAAVEANLVHWVDGAHRGPDVVPAEVRDAVREMQRRAFELTLPWPDEVWEAEDELDPGPVDRIGEITAPMLVLHGALDMASVRDAADRLTERAPDVRRVDWPDVAHLPSMERPADFADLALGWLSEVDADAQA